MAKKKIKNKKPSEAWKKYKVEGDKVIKAKYCPKCGLGYFLGNHSNRYVCGHCGYVEMKKKE